MYSNVIQKLWVVKWKTVAGCFLLILAFKELNFNMQEFGSLLSQFVCLWRVTLCRQGEDLTAEVLFCQRVDGGLDIGSRADMFMWQHHLTALTLHRETSSKETTVYLLKSIGTPIYSFIYLFILAAKHQVDGLSVSVRSKCISNITKVTFGRRAFNNQCY